MRAEFLLEEFAGARIYFECPEGNHGDRLILHRAKQLLHGRQRVARPGQADLILLNGGGFMSPLWSGWQRLRHYSRKYPDVPLAIWPSSYQAPARPLSYYLADRKASLWLWAREPLSLHWLQEQCWPCQHRLFCDHDLALGLDGDPLLASLSSLPRRHCLVVERDDAEGPTGRTRP